MNNTIDQAAEKLLALDSKVGLLGTADDEGFPHLTFVSSLQGFGERGITFGQFMVGLSKEFLPKRPECAFLALSADMNWLRGNARFTHTAITGPEFDMYNNKPLFRYNTYVGINTVWYLDLLGISDIQKLPKGKIAAGALRSRAAALRATSSEKNALSPFSRQLFAKIDNPKFICFEMSGTLTIVPIVQATHAGTDRVVFADTPYGEDLKAIPAGMKVCVLALNLETQSVLTKGTFLGKRGACYVVDVERVYNPMPPAIGYIYPKKTRPVAITEF